MSELSSLKDLIDNDELRVSLDTRKLSPGEYYIPIVGENFDGHSFIDSALKKGAAGIIEEETLYVLTKYKLSKVNPKIIGVTGSAGKTTTTNFIHHILGKKYKSTLGKLNTKLGLSVNTINDMSLDTQIFVAEMGMDSRGEIFFTSNLFKPHIAVVTTVNAVHAQKVGTLQDIVQTKLEILKNLLPGGYAVLNSDNEYIVEEAKKYTVDKVWFGLNNICDFHPSKINVAKFGIFGEHNLRNLLASYAVATFFDFVHDELVNISAELSLPKGRLNILQGINGSTIIDDTYNASPESVEYALKVLHQHNSPRKIAILGDMLELGIYENELHKHIGQIVNELKPHYLITVGNRAKVISDTSIVKNKLHFNSWDEFTCPFSLGSEDVVLVKGSQGMRMEKITQSLLADPSSAKEVLVRQDITWK